MAEQITVATSQPRAEPAGRIRRDTTMPTRDFAESLLHAMAEEKNKKDRSTG